MKNQPLQENKKPVSSTIPLPSDGRDGSQRFIADGGFIYMYYKYNSEWYKVKMEKA